MVEIRQYEVEEASTPTTETGAVVTTKQDKRDRQKAVSMAIRDGRKDARWRIIQLANQHAMRDRAPVYRQVYMPNKNGGPGNYETGMSWRQPRLLGMNNLNRAVRIVRHHKLGNEVLLRSAGFRP